MPLSERIAIITGASAGIGRAVALELARGGCGVVVNARRAGALGELVREVDALSAGTKPVSPRAVAVVGDAVEQSTIDALFAAAERVFARPADLVVVNAGRGLAGSITTSDPAQWEEMVNINILGASRLLRTSAARLLALVNPNPEGESGVSGPWLARAGGGRDIIVLGSNVGRHISPFSSMYGSTKFAVNSLAEALRRELGPKGIRVSLIEPGIVRTEFQSVAGYDPKTFGQFMDRVGPVLSAEDVARVVGFIASQPPHVHVNNVVVRPTRQDYP